MKPCLANKAKLSRTSTEKTRTGCITCKRRHVKCDEGRPHCDNCLKRGGSCEGYATRLRKKKLPGQLCWHSKEVVHVEIPSIQLLVDPDSLNPQDGMGMLYFLEFVSLAQSPWTSAVSNSDLWSATLPQIARDNDTLRSAATAIGALSIWRQQSSNRPCCKVSVPSGLAAAEDVHYFHAVAYYCRALRLHQQQMSSQGVILLSMLLLLFELLRGDTRAALDHVNHGLALLFTSLMDGDAHGFVGDLSPNPKPLLEAVVGTFIYLTTNTRAILSGRLDKGPALPNLTKGLRSRKQTVASFITLLSRFSGPLIVKGRIPAAFDSLEEFEEHWAAARRRQTAMSVIMLEGLQASNIPEPIDDCSTNRFFTDLCGNARIRDYSKDSAKVVRELDTAFSPLFNRLITGNVESSTYLKAVHLRLQLLGFYLFEDPPQMIDIESLQSQTPKYHEFLSLARSVIQSARQEITNPSHQVSLQCTLAWHLLIISLFCRDPLARDEAMQMLRDYPGQDGLWSTRGLYVLARRNCALERANAGEGMPEEQWRRLLRREFVFEDGGDRVVFRYLEKNKSSDQWDLVEEVAEVEGDALEVQWKRRRPTGTGGLLMVELYKN